MTNRMVEKLNYRKTRRFLGAKKKCANFAREQNKRRLSAARTIGDARRIDIDRTNSIGILIKLKTITEMNSLANGGPHPFASCRRAAVKPVDYKGGELSNLI